MNLSRPAIAGLAVLYAGPAFADAVTYQGTLGKLPIVVELSAPLADAKEPFAGRYFYASKGIDIPLDPVEFSAGGKAQLAEEAPCTEETCPDDDTPAPLGAKWQLSANADGSTITGTWSDNGKSLPISLKLYGSRPLPETFDGKASTLADTALLAGFDSDGQEIGKNDVPYDYLRLQVHYDASPETRWGDAGFVYLTDPRTEFQFPRITTLSGTSPDAANHVLEQRQWAMSTAALNCMAGVYKGTSWMGYNSFSAGTLGGYDDEGVEVQYLSPTVMSWTETGSLYCGQAHPDNHHSFHTIDVKTGQPLDMSLIFKGWVPTRYDGEPAADLDTVRANPDDYSWGPDRQLADFVRAHREHEDAETESDCGFDDLIADNLKISFVNGDRVLFALDDLPHVIFACSEDIYEAPIADLRDLLTPEATTYFPILAAKNPR